MENSKKLTKAELKAVTGGSIGHKVHCVDENGVEHFLEADICPQNSMTYCLLYEPANPVIISAYCV